MEKFVLRQTLHNDIRLFFLTLFSCDETYSWNIIPKSRDVFSFVF